MKSVLATCVVSFAAVVTLLVNPTTAHPANDFYPTGRRWIPNTTEDWVFDNNVPTGNFRDQVSFGVGVWDNGAGGNGPDFIEIGQATVSNNFDACDQQWSVVFVYENLGGALGWGNEQGLGYTPTCRVATIGGTFVQKFQMTFEKTAELGGASGWYTGTGSPGPQQWDLRSIAVHETGHATGWYGHFTGNTNCPSPPVAATTHTMCQGDTAVKSTTMLRTREEHDVHTFQNAY